MRLGVSAVQHDMKREETVEEVEKNTELERQTPKRKVGSSNLPGGAKRSQNLMFWLLFVLYRRMLWKSLKSKFIECP